MFSCTVLFPFRRDFYQWSSQDEPSITCITVKWRIRRRIEKNNQYEYSNTRSIGRPHQQSAKSNYTFLANQKVRIKLIQSNQSEMVSYFHENLNKRIGVIAQTVYTDVYNCLRRRLSGIWLKNVAGFEI